MNVRRSLLALLIAATMLATSGMSAFAAGVEPADPVEVANSDTTQVSVTIEPLDDGMVSVTIQDSPNDEFENFDYSFNEQHATSTIWVDVTDTRGTAKGWTLTVKVSDFRGLQGNEIPARNLILLPAEVYPLGGNFDVSELLVHTVSGTPDFASKLIEAPENSGDGSFRSFVDLQLRIPPGTLVDTYTSTITVEITGNAP